MWTVASTTALFATFASDIGIVLATVLASVLTALAALIGLGYAVRKVRRYITGRKF